MELAPIYDVNNAAAFRAHYKEQRPRVAQSIGGEFNPTLVTAAHRDSMSESTGLNPRLVRSALVSMARSLPRVADARRECLRGEPGDCAELVLVVADISGRCARVGAGIYISPGMIRKSQPKGSAKP